MARYNGPGNLDDVARPIAVDRSGNVYITGYSEDPTNGLDYLTIKYDSAGQQQWVKRYDGPVHDWDMPEAIAVDLSGNVYVTGESIGGAGYFGFATINNNSADRGNGSLGTTGNQRPTTLRSRSLLIRWATSM